MVLQHQDENIGPGSFSSLCGDQMLITKIFPTFQGEGPHAGRPAVFIRTAGCNRGKKVGMGCEFCDTAFYFDQGIAMTFKEIEKQVQAAGHERFLATGGHEPLIVITGGEPMMQNNLTGLLRHLRNRGYHSIQIESNGDRLAPGFVGNADLVISPKVSKGGYHRPKDEVLAYATALKFVVEADPISPYVDVPEWAEQFNTCVSPITVYKRAHHPRAPVSAWDTTLVDHEATARNYAHARNIALTRGFRLSMQMHLFFAVE